MRHHSSTPAGANAMARWAGRALTAAALAAITLTPQSIVTQTDGSPSASIPSPEEFFGHQMGADRKLARWDKLGGQGPHTEDDERASV